MFASMTEIIDLNDTFSNMITSKRITIEQVSDNVYSFYIGFKEIFIYDNCKITLTHSKLKYKEEILKSGVTKKDKNIITDALIDFSLTSYQANLKYELLATIMYEYFQFFSKELSDTEIEENKQIWTILRKI